MLALCGCGGRTVSVKGTLVPPADVQLQDSDSVAINLQPVDAKDASGGMAVYNAADKSFVIKSADGQGIAPGKYKVPVRITPYPGSADSEKRAAAFDDLNNKYASGDKLSYEVTGDANQDIVIDLAKGTIAKK